MNQEEIIRRYEQRLIAALSGEEAEIDVCGLSVEALRDEIVRERDQFLKQCGDQDEETRK